MCGVALLVSKDLDVKLTVLSKDRCGRFLIVRAKFASMECIVVNVYMNTSNHERAQMQLLGEIILLLEDVREENILFMGD